MNVESLVDLVSKGKTPEQIASRLDCDPELVREELARLAISPVAPPKRSQGRSPPTAGY